ncbi:MAG: hypothetical protein CM15mP23_02600 [Cryomorphaceae bacterium]|nr:MAG: hypothetical protein CM15mP23_02600 [Cryomorphaceae bacterium]
MSFLKDSMFIIGTIIFVLYMMGLIYMINWGHKSHNKNKE